MHDTVYNYEIGPDDLFVGDDEATRVIVDLFERCSWEGNPAEMAENPQGTLELLEVDTDGTGLYGTGGGWDHSQHGLRYRYRQYIWLRPCGGGEYEAASKWLDDDPRVEAAIEAIEDASTLDALAGALNAELAPDVEEQVYERVDMTSLPTFGGDEPESGTAGVWSWDERRVLVGDSAPFEIVSRREWEAKGE